MTRGIRLVGFFGLALAAALVVFISSQDSRAVTPFAPGVVFCFENVDTTADCDGDPSPGANSDLRNKFCIGWNTVCSQQDANVTDSNFGGVVAFTPTSVTLPAGPDVPIGALAGRLTAISTLGLLNGPCSSTIQVAFSLMNASVNLGDTIAPKAPGEADVMEPLALDADGNGLPDGADKYPAFLSELFDPGGVPLQPRARLFGISRIQGSWIALNFNFFEPGATFEAAGTTITFKEEFGYPSVTVLQDPTAPAAAGPISDFCAPLLSQNVALGVTRDNPCSGAHVGAASCPGDTVIFGNRGYPLFPCETGNSNDEDKDGKINDGCPQVNQVSEEGAQCDNDVSDDPEDSDVNDGCPPFGDVSEGGRIPGTCSGTDEGGCIYRTNPATAGDIQFSLLVASQRDADGDGIENSLDVCSLEANGAWNPRAADAVNDTDLDGLPNECDPNPSTQSAGSPQTCKAGFVGYDEDVDCFSNRQDNCPTDSQLQDPSQPASDTNLPIAEDEDSDGIGDVCDPNPDQVNGEIVINCLYVPITIGAGASTAPREPTVDPNGPVCAAAVLVTGSPAVTPPGQTPGSSGNTNTGGGSSGGGSSGGGSGGVGGAGTSGIGSLAPTSTNLPVWAAILAVAGGFGVVLGVGILGTQRVRRRPDSD